MSQVAEMGFRNLQKLTTQFTRNSNLHTKHIHHTLFPSFILFFPFLSRTQTNLVYSLSPLSQNREKDRQRGRDREAENQQNKHQTLPQSFIFSAHTLPICHVISATLQISPLHSAFSLIFPKFHPS